MVNPLTYPSSQGPFSLETFQSPPKEYRGSPFWAWVTKQEKESTVEQVKMFDEMGMGGFHMHTRVGLDIPYLGEEFMDIVKGCVDEAKARGMSALLYDEDRWPSGFAGGQVLKDHPELRHLHLLFTPWAYGEEVGYTKPTFPIANAAPVRSELGTLLAAYAIRLSDGLLTSARRIDKTNVSEAQLSSDEKIWYAYAEPLPNSGFFGDETYTDLLSSEMTRRFISLTHEKYKESVGDEFGSTVPSIFTDEPQYCPFSPLDISTNLQDVFLPWTRTLPDTFNQKAGQDLLDLLPELIWDTKEKQSGSGARYLFLDHVCELFADNYVGEIAKWCGKNNLICTGHMNAEPTLLSQTRQTGEVMRCYRDMHMPGIDMLCDKQELNTAKQAASVARQYGRSGVMSELYGVTGWQFTFEGHKGQGDWQAALGVTLRVHHLFWSTMEGEAKRDYPGCIGYQSPWWQEYSSIETHFARVNSVLTRGKPVVRVAVIHPIESYWLAFGPKDTSGNDEEREYREKAFEELTQWLLGANIDFDFVSESLFPTLTPLEEISSTLPVGEMDYQVVIVPNLRTIRSSTLERLQRFAEQGGRVVIAGISPTLIDAKVPLEEPTIGGAITPPWSRAQILSTLHPYRDIEMIISDTTLYRTRGQRADSLFYQMREDGEERFVFICNIDRKESCPVNITLRGEYAVHVLDTMSGKNWEIAAKQAQGRTTLKYWFDGCESVVLRLVRDTSSSKAKEQTIMRRHFMQVGDVTLKSVTLSEPNVLLLDYALYQFNDEAWSEPEEILRIDQLLRRRLGFFIKGAKIPQPYTIPDSAREPVGKLKLRFTFYSDIEVNGALLAIESPDKVLARLDDQPLGLKAEGWWVDRCIKTISLPSLDRGEHTLELEYKYGQLTNLERIYILGDFGVSVRGRSTKIVELERDKLEWGDITRQNLPFYSGNIYYNCTFQSDGVTPQAIRVAHFSSPAIAVDVDGERIALLVHEPYACELGVVKKGEHQITFTCFGNRHNSFGALHLVDNKTNWLNADSWRSDFDWWSEEYVLGKMGIFNSPRVQVPGLEVPKQTRLGIKLHA